MISDCRRFKCPLPGEWPILQTLVAGLVELQRVNIGDCGCICGPMWKKENEKGAH